MTLLVWRGPDRYARMLGMSPFPCHGGVILVVKFSTKPRVPAWSQMGQSIYWNFSTAGNLLGSCSCSRTWYIVRSHYIGNQPVPSPASLR